MTSTLITKERKYSPSAAMHLIQEGATPLMAKILASRQIEGMWTLEGRLKHLISHKQLKNADQAAQLLFQAIQNQDLIVILADYDCDGATACAVAVRGLRAMGANVNYVVPDRMIHGYGLTPSVVDVVMERFPEAAVLVTVDNGIASFEGVIAAKSKGMTVIVTDHHLPVESGELPAADCIVNPVQPDCSFPSKSLAGVGVIWYLLWALQDLLRSEGIVIASQNRVSHLLPLVAVGTVADVVTLDANNRLLVQAGLLKIRNKEGFAGIEALASVGFGNQTSIEYLLTSDIAFGIGPRINAAGRLETMDLGIECLLTDDLEEARELAKELDGINQKRKSVEQSTIEEAVSQAQEQINESSLTIVAHHPSWHAGVIGIVAGRLKEKHWRPAFVLSTDPSTGEIKGSGRSIVGFNLKDTLDQVDKAIPGVLLRFGGHAMAAGLTLAPGTKDIFAAEFERQTRKLIDPAILNEQVLFDGELSATQITITTYRQLASAPWGQGFIAPIFKGSFEVLDVKKAGPAKDQLRLTLSKDGLEFEAIAFRFTGTAPSIGNHITLLYNLNLRKPRNQAPKIVLLVNHLILN